MTTCPACQREIQDDQQVCPHCGVILAKWRPRGPSLPTAVRTPTHIELPISTTQVAAAVALVIMGVLAYFYFSDPRDNMKVIKLGMPDRFHVLKVQNGNSEITFAKGPRFEQTYMFTPGQVDDRVFQGLMSKLLASLTIEDARRYYKHCPDFYLCNSNCNLAYLDSKRMLTIITDNLKIRQNIDNATEEWFRNKAIPLGEQTCATFSGHRLAITAMTLKGEPAVMQESIDPKAKEFIWAFVDGFKRVNCKKVLDMTSM